jgi:hypothetical protein
MEIIRAPRYDRLRCTCLRLLVGFEVVEQRFYEYGAVRLLP